MGKRQGKTAGAAGGFILAATMVLCVLLPARAMFTGDGFLADYLVLRETREMLLELGILFLMFLGLFLRKGHERLRIGTAVAAVLVFCWIHVTFLPMLVSGLYLAFLLMTGWFLRTMVFRMGNAGGWPADFVLGSSFVISLFCFLSAMGIGSIRILRVVSLVLGILLLGWYLIEVRFLDREDPDAEELGSVSGFLERAQLALRHAGTVERLAYAFLLVMVLLQVGRVGIALDFDTLWYGVRSEYILAGGGGIYEDPGLVGMVYVYSKGWEILTLPLCDLPSHSYLIFFNLWLAVLGFLATGRLARLFMGESGTLLSMVLTAAIPGIMNMAVSAKTDMITWFLQLLMADFFFRYVRAADRRKRPVLFLILTAGTYFLSLTMKPTALVFSTAVFGMMGIYLLLSGRLALRARICHWLGLLPPVTALAAVWLRTFRITGMPVTSVFTSLLSRLGFGMKYPFAVSGLPANYEEGESVFHLLFRRLYQILLAPEGKDMLHVTMAWGSSLLLFLTVFMVLSLLGVSLFRRDRRQRAGYSFRKAAGLIFWPFLAVNLVSLVMLYQVDGNYFMLLYTMLLLFACHVFSGLRYTRGKKVFLALLFPLLVFNLLVTANTSWAWCAGFTPVQLVNRGYVDHEAQEKSRMEISGNAEIWKILESDPSHRVISFGEHPYCLQFPCNVQSYKDVTAPWGNVELVNSPEAFEEYMEYAKTDFVYAQAGYLGEENWAWSYHLLRDLIRRGTLTDLYFSAGNCLARRSEAGVDAEKAAENLKMFDEHYRTYVSEEELLE